MKPTAEKYLTTNWKGTTRRSKHLVRYSSGWILRCAGTSNAVVMGGSSQTTAICSICHSVKHWNGAKPAQGGRSGLASADFSTVSLRQKHVVAAIESQATKIGLHFLIDSTGIKMLAERAWKTKEHRDDYRRQWREVLLGIDAAILKIRTIEVTDTLLVAPVVVCPLEQISVDETITSASSDCAYNPKGRREAIAERDAQAVIPRAETPNYWNTSFLVQRHETLSFKLRVVFASGSEKKWTGHHERSFVETKMRCFRLLGERVIAPDCDGQAADLRARAAILNRFTRLGTPITVAMS